MNPSQALVNCDELLVPFLKKAVEEPKTPGISKLYTQ